MRWRTAEISRGPPSVNGAPGSSAIRSPSIAICRLFLVGVWDQDHLRALSWQMIPFLSFASSTKPPPSSSSSSSSLSQKPLPVLPSFASQYSLHAPFHCHLLRIDIPDALTLVTRAWMSFPRVSQVQNEHVSTYPCYPLASTITLPESYAPRINISDDFVPRLFPFTHIQGVMLWCHLTSKLPIGSWCWIPRLPLLSSFMIQTLSCLCHMDLPTFFHFPSSRSHFGS